MSRYSDRYLNALMAPHKMTSRAELYFGGGKVGDLQLVEGLVNADRGSLVRRTFEGTLDPTNAPASLTDKLTPYGSQLKVFRGIEYNDTTIDEFPVFYGRVESVDFGLNGVTVRCADLAADVVDTRFEVPRTGTRGAQIRHFMRDLIQEAVPGVTVDILTTDTSTITTPSVWDRERSEALQSLAPSISSEWFAMADGTFQIAPLPAVQASPVAVWIVDSGDIGVAIERLTVLDRADVYNSVVVNGEPSDSTPAVYAVARDTNPASPTRWGGPFGKVPAFFSSGVLTSTAQAQATANALLVSAIAGTRSVEVRCVPNAKLRLGDVVFISTGQAGFDGMYYANAFTLPAGPGEPMTMVCDVVLTTTVAGDIVDAPVVFGEGISWP